MTRRLMGRPRAATKAYRIVARPYDGWLYADQFWTIEEWYREERTRARYRRYRSRRHAAAYAAETPPAREEAGA